MLFPVWLRGPDETTGAGAGLTTFGGRFARVVAPTAMGLPGPVGTLPVPGPLSA